MRERGDDVIRVPRTGVFFTAYPDNTPLALRANFEHNHTVHETVVVVSIEPLNVPHVRGDERLKHDDLGYEDDGICHVTARYGFQDDIDIPGSCAARSSSSRATSTSRTSPTSSRAPRSRSPTIRAWRAGARSCSSAIARNAANPVGYFNLPGRADRRDGSPR